MKKTFHFLAGLPRSGNTLLSALLNQNPFIYSSPLSQVPNLMWSFIESCETSEQTKRNTENKIKSDIFLSSFIDNFYKDVEKPFVIDRDKAWGTPSNLAVIKQYITPAPKIIFTVRNILEILASLIDMETVPSGWGAYDAEYYIANYREKNDVVAEHIMRMNGEIDKGLLSLASAFYPENRGVFHIVEYKDLILHPEKTMCKIYDFLEMPNYEHNFNKIKKVEIDNDEVLGLPKNLHEIKESLSYSSTSTDMLSEYIQNKYSNMEFWRHDSIMKIRGRDF